MGRNYTEVESLKVIKDLLNLLYGDTKRFNVLRNKFKKSVTDFKVKDNKIVEVQFASVTQQVINDELEVAIESLKGYAARSAKKQAEFDAIIECKGIDLEVAKTGKTKTIKVTKTDSGKLAKVVKDSTLPKEKEPKEVKKVKNKNEPSKKPVKSEPKKTIKSVISKGSAKKKSDSSEKSNTEKNTEKNTVEDLIKTFVNNLKMDEIKTLISNTIEAFSGDSKLNVTMTNWVKKTNTDKDAAIGMLTSAYTRKPKNSKMQEWYRKLEATFLAPEKPDTNSEVKHKEVDVGVVEIAKPEVEEVSKVVKDDACKYEFISNLFGIFSLKPIMGQFNIALSALTLKALTSYNVNINDKVSFTLDISLLELTKLYLEEYTKIEEVNQTLDFEANLLGKNILNCFTSSYIRNLELALTKSIGMFPSVAHRESKIKEFKEKLKVKEFSENLDTMTQTETYIFGRKFVNTVLEYVISLDNNTIFYNYMNIFGEVIIRSCMNLEALKKHIITDPIESGIEETFLAVEDNEAIEASGIKYSISAMDISFVFQNTSFNISKMDARFQEIKEAVISNDEAKLNSLLVTKQNVVENLKNVLSELPGDIIEVVSEGQISNDDQTKDIDIKIVDKTIIYNGKVYKGNLSSEFIKYLALNDKDKIRMFKQFIINCGMNPLPSAVEELYDFVFVNKLTVTPTGTVLLYKWVNEDYKDCHTRTFLNKPGLTVTMDRARVNADRNITCSSGLHLCSYGYGKFGTRLLLCEVHPRDVVSIPTDYNRSKLRCCRYTTLIDITEFYGAFEKKGDFLSKAQNIHYNPKILELEVMKLYPDVVRVNSTFDLNGMSWDKNSDIISKILYGSEVNKATKKAKEAKETENTKEMEKVENTELIDTESELPNELLEELVYDEVDVTDNVEIQELEAKEESIEEQIVEPEVEFSEEIFKDHFRIFLASGEISIILLHNFDEVLQIEKYGFDKTYKDICLEQLSSDIKTNFEATEEKIKFLELYRTMYLEATSVAHLEERDINIAQQIPEQDEVTSDKNVDKIKIVETPKADTESIVKKVGSFLKKLF